MPSLIRRRKSALWDEPETSPVAVPEEQTVYGLTIYLVGVKYPISFEFYNNSLRDAACNDLADSCTGYISLRHETREYKVNRAQVAYCLLQDYIRRR